MTMYPVTVGEAVPKNETEGKRHFHYDRAAGVNEYRTRGFIFSVMSDPASQDEDIREVMGDYIVSARGKKKLFSLKMAVRKSGLEGDFFLGIMNGKVLRFSATDKYFCFVVRRGKIIPVNHHSNEKMHCEAERQYGEFALAAGDRLVVVSENVKQILTERIMLDVMEEYTVQIAAKELSARAFFKDQNHDSQVLTISTEVPGLRPAFNLRVVGFILILCALFLSAAFVLKNRMGARIPLPDNGGETTVIIPDKPEDDGSSAEINLLEGNYPVSHEVLWEKHFDGSVTSSPALGGGYVFVASKDTYLYAYKETDFELVWRTRMAYAMAAEPVYDSGYVYIGTYKGYLYKLDARTGGIIWKIKTGRKIISKAVPDDKRVYFASTDGYLYAADKKTGEKAWRFPTKNVIWSDPVFAGETVVAASLDRHLYSVDRETGKLEWKLYAGSDIYSSPAVHGGRIYFGADNGALYAVDAGNGNIVWKKEFGKAISGRITWFNGQLFFGCDDGKVYSVDDATGATVWSYTTGDVVISGAVINSGILYIGSYDKNIYALNIKDGSLVWKAPMAGAVYGKPLAMKKVVVAGDESGVLRCFQADLGKLKPVVLK